MKTPLQELFEYESDLTNMFDSDVRVAGALLEYIRTNKKDMLEKEKKFLEKFEQRKAIVEIMKADEKDRLYDETFNTKDR
jgi:hypothetical protein|tara:strand:+ start:257 stop:496 length:240 start_codon:yes stop_codon:yes gene_type:complete